MLDMVAVRGMVASRLRLPEQDLVSKNTMRHHESGKTLRHAGCPFARQSKDVIKTQRLTLDMED
jgi:hypothetical protein